MPLAQDILTRIINVHWGGDTKFVYGTLQDNALYYVEVKRPNDKLVQKTVVPPGPGRPDLGLSCMGSSFSYHIENAGTPEQKRTPVFLVCGNRVDLFPVDDGAGNIIRLPGYHTMIFRSKDGLEWSFKLMNSGEPISLQEPGINANPVALVWDAKDSAFYYDQAKDDKDEVYRSPDGVEWSLVSSTPVSGIGDPASYKSPFLAHTVGNACTDAFGQHVPDGVMSVPDTTAAQPVLPPIISYATGTSSFEFASGGETYGGAQIQITKKEKTIVTVPGVAKVFCVARKGDVVMAGGAADIAGDTGAVAISYDLGVTWKTVAHHQHPVTTMVANARL
jgi:hypothetical protein